VVAVQQAWASALTLVDLPLGWQGEASFGLRPPPGKFAFGESPTIEQAMAEVAPTLRPATSRSPPIVAGPHPGRHRVAVVGRQQAPLTPARACSRS
jgi:hypothetical protein